MKKLALILAAIALLIAAGIGYVRHEFRSARRHAESLVAQTIESIQRLGAPETLTLHAITNAAVGGASVHILSTNPVVFMVSAATPWPDWMIYEYDSKTPERGIYHYLF